MRAGEAVHENTGSAAERAVSGRLVIELSYVRAAGAIQW